ncbi:hypothetical protein [Arthrobacter sp. Soil763]|uniref:hypothetical protein n=1 Tax=Arthrobacter sp. Soil763 TaxID=1736402 RepID=UPI0006F2942B|nr:hypothetical protein [Arthrobacter sp. Soil763]KRE79774.1 hypothetical protein ASG71_06915 [Arthrobacter sp. Soil763]
MKADPNKSGDVNAELPTEDPTGQDPAAADPAADVKLQLQLAIFEVSKDSKGKSLGEITESLRSAIASRGVEEPPLTWLESVASSAFYGEPYIIDFPTAVAADAAVPAPNEAVRKRLASRRKLRAEQLPAEIFPSASEWNVPDGETRGGAGPGKAPRSMKGSVILGVIGAVIAATIVVVQSARTSSRRGTSLPTRSIKGQHR